MEKLVGRSPWVTRAMEQHLSSLQPLLRATWRWFLHGVTQAPSGQCSAALRGEARPVPIYPILWAMGPIRLIASYFPLKDTQILASPAAGLSLQGGLISGAS